MSQPNPLLNFIRLCVAKGYQAIDEVLLEDDVLHEYYVSFGFSDREAMHAIVMAQWDAIRARANRLKVPRLGEPQLIDFTEKDGTIGKRLMRPLLDEFGGWISWVKA